MIQTKQSILEKKICLITDVFKQGMYIDEGLKPFPLPLSELIREAWRKDGNRHISGHTFDALYNQSNQYLTALVVTLEPAVDRKMKQRMQSILT